MTRKKAQLPEINLENSEFGDKLLLIFPKKYCAPNINYELPFLEKIYSHYPSSIVIGRIDDTNYNLKTMISRESADATNINEIKIRQNNTGKVKLPELYLISEEGVVLLSRESIFGKDTALKNFYKKVDSIFSIIYEKEPIFNFRQTL